MRLRAVAAIIVACAVAAVAAAAWLATSPTPTLRERPVIVEIPAHASTLDIARLLEDHGAVHQRWLALAISGVRGQLRSLKAGEYEFPRGSSPLGVMRTIESGRVRQHAVLHAEGATLNELARALEGERLAPAADVLRVASDPGFLAAQRIPGPSAEGYIFPDTYYFVRGMRVEEMLGRMVQRMRAKVGPDIEERARARGISLHELLTLASIVEREAVSPDEMSLIAAVFWNRLKRDMPLQADPTVQYAVQKERGTLTRSDLERDHPFNTYRNAGLPPGPIASPGLRAIEATLEPAPVKFLYFVAIDERRHHFSTTVEEHNAAVARYRRWRGR
jgi:UPF0755 protein